MQLTSMLILTLLALGVSAFPGFDARSSQPSCQGGKVYNCAHNTCNCPPDQYWDTGKNKCCYQPMPQPQCPQGQNPYCSQDKDHYCKYDQNNDYCQDNGWGSTWCCADQNIPTKIPQIYPPKQCPDKQEWCADKQQCECPAPMQWDQQENKCQWPPMPKPSCPPMQMPYCGKSKTEYCQYDQNNDYCSNDGTCYTWCATPDSVSSLVQSIFSLL